MSSMPWIKLYTETLDDPKMGRLGDRLWRRVLEMFMLAGRAGAGGFLPSVDDIAWILRIPADELSDDLDQLQQVNIVKLTDDGWFVVHFAERQDADSNAERQKRYREKKQHQQYVGTPVVTEIDNVVTDTPVTQSNETHNDVSRRIDKIREDKIKDSSPVGERRNGNHKTNAPFWKPEVLQIAKVFAKERGCSVPVPNNPAGFAKVNNRWVKPLQDVLELCNGDMERVGRIIQLTVQHMIANHLTFDAPDQIVKTAGSILADLESGKLVDAGMQLTSEEQTQRVLAATKENPIPKGMIL